VRRLAASAPALLALALLAPPAAAEDLVAALSTGSIAITSSFTGTTVTLFGSIERDANTVARPGGYDIVVSIRGPGETVTTRRKERVLGIWVNRGAETHVNIPAYYAALSNRPLDDIAPPPVRRRLQLGLEALVLPVSTETLADSLANQEAFAAAFLRLKRQQGLYRELPNGVEFLSPSLFRASIPLPANVPVGEYTVSIHLLAASALLKSRTTEISIAKTGFEQAVVELATDRPVVYGMITLAFAFFVGWLASVLFRRD